MLMFDKKKEDKSKCFQSWWVPADWDDVQQFLTIEWSDSWSSHRLAVLLCLPGKRGGKRTQTSHSFDSAYKYSSFPEHWHKQLYSCSRTLELLLHSWHLQVGGFFLCGFSLTNGLWTLPYLSDGWWKALMMVLIHYCVEFSGVFWSYWWGLSVFC